MSGKRLFFSAGRTRELVWGLGFKSRGVFVVVAWPFQCEIGWGYP
jgi:hypothetical protein